MKYIENTLKNFSDGTFKKNGYNIKNDKFQSNFKKKKSKNTQKVLGSFLGTVNYFTTHTSLHGIKYSTDDELHKIERIIWMILVVFGFCGAISVIFEFNRKFEAKETQVKLDDVNYHVSNVPFPSVTICPGTRIDWNEITNLTDTLISANDTETRNTLKNFLLVLATMKHLQLYKLDVKATDHDLKVLDKINVTELMLKLLPKCENFFIRCKWQDNKQNCCDIFRIQLTQYGFCYSFNSLISINKKYDKPLSTRSFGIRSGLKCSIDSQHLYNPPGSLDNQTIFFMISHPSVYPTKVRFLTYGMRYNIDIKFSSAYSSEEVLDLENSKRAPCRYLNNTYRFENCLLFCSQKLIQDACRCNPTFLYPVDAKLRECNFRDFKCIALTSIGIDDMWDRGIDFEPRGAAELNIPCDCITECNYCEYQDSVLGFPAHDGDNIAVLDFHFDGPTGVRYKRDVVISRLDLLVQVGGIFGLFMGGSILTVIEFLYFFFIATIVYVYKNLVCYIKRNDDVPENQTIYVHPTAYNNNNNNNNFKKIYPLLDFPIRTKRSVPRY